MTTRYTDSDDAIDLDAWRRDPVAFADIWQHDEAPYLHNPDWLEDWRDIWSQITGGFADSFICRPMMSGREQAAYDALPEFVTIWRGVNLPADEDASDQHPAYRGMSWTMDRDRAVWFARRFLGVIKHDGRRYDRGYVAEAVVHKSAIFAVFLDREEAEIVVDHELIEIDRIEELAPEAA